MPITIDVKPDLSRFRQCTAEEIMAAVPQCDSLIAAEIIENFVVLPR